MIIRVLESWTRKIRGSAAAAFLARGRLLLQVTPFFDKGRLDNTSQLVNEGTPCSPKLEADLSVLTRLQLSLPPTHSNRTVVTYAAYSYRPESLLCSSFLLRLRVMPCLQTATRSKPLGKLLDREALPGYPVDPVKERVSFDPVPRFKEVVDVPSLSRDQPIHWHDSIVLPPGDVRCRSPEALITVSANPVRCCAAGPRMTVRSQCTHSAR
jgi:hypothetical protein